MTVTTQVTIAGPDGGSVVIDTDRPSQVAVDPSSGDALIDVAGEQANGTVTVDGSQSSTVDVTGTAAGTVVTPGQDPDPIVVDIGGSVYYITGGGGLPSAPVSVDLDYDTDGRLVLVTSADSTTRALSYSPSGELSTVIKRDAGASVVWTKTLTFDNDGRLDLVTVT